MARCSRSAPEVRGCVGKLITVLRQRRAEGGDPVENFRQRSVEEDDFDWNAEREHFERSGWEFPTPFADRVEALHELIRAVGWEGARTLCDEEFAGHEADALPRALSHLEADRKDAELQYLGRLVRGGR